MRRKIASLLLFVPLIVLGSDFLVPCFAQQLPSRIINVQLITDEAEAVLAIVSKNASHEAIDAKDWEQLFSSEGYVRLKKRELSMKRPFEDKDFEAFVLSDDLTKRGNALKETLERWKKADLSGAAKLALAYLPSGATIHARIYPVIKPRDNSFVFEVKENPAIFLYLDPQVSREKFENTLAHEFHHIGYGTACPTSAAESEIAQLPDAARTVVKLIGAFGEGFAMLAAAGGPDIHPHAVSGPDERARWDKDVANFNLDLKKVESFLLDLLNKHLTDEQIQETASSLFGIQGPWYTVGWKMAWLIEKTYGRATLVECICDQRKLVTTYNRAATLHNRGSKDQLALWSDELISAIGARQ